MKIIFNFIRYVLLAALFLGAGAGAALSMVKPGDVAPQFQEKNLEGDVFDLSKMADSPMLILFFFDVESESSRDLLLSIGKLSQRFSDARLAVWGITRSNPDKLSEFVKTSKPGFPVLMDRSGVSLLYGATMILPTVCIIGPKLTVMDYFQGGGKHTEIMMVRLAERNLQRRETMVAKAISEEVVKTNPKNVAARAVKGYADLAEGKPDQAREVFEKIAEEKGEGEILGKEGMAAVYAKKGESGKALAAAEEVRILAPDRPLPHVVKADILYSQGNKDAAAREYEEAAAKTEGAAQHKALAYNQFGRFQASVGNYSQARQLYDQAVEIDPYYIEATSNKGVTYEREGQWDQALGSYRQALSINKNDTFAAVLARKAEEMLAFQNDAQKRDRVERLVKELAERFKNQKSFWEKKEDTWTSRPMVLSFVDFQEKGGLSERDGYSSVLTTNLADRLNASGRVRVVERVVIDRLLEELNLGSSDLADPETALQLGRVLAAKILGTGSLFFLPDGTLLSLRLIDTETTAIAKVISKQLSSSMNLEKDLNELNRDILQTIIGKYPLQGFVVRADGKQVLINIGANQGVVLGTRLQVLLEQEPVKYKGKLLKASPKPIAVIEVTEVEPDFSHANVVSQETSIKPDSKVREVVDESVIAVGG